MDSTLAHQIIEDATDYAIFTLDPAGRITSWSAGAERILGYAADQAIGADFAILFLEADRAADLPRMEIARALELGRAEDTRWHVRRGGERFWANGVTMRLVEGTGLVKVMRDETAAKLAEDHRVLLLNELNHRLKNTLVTVQSIVDHTLRSHKVAPEARKAVTDRLIALSDAHNVLVEQNWAGADLQVIVERAIAPYRRPEAKRFTVDGPPLRLSPQQAVGLSLALHELCTNALKHGALTADAGAVDISWNIAQDGDGSRRMTLLWRESGGPPVGQPTRHGFGTRLIARSFGLDSGGQARLHFAPEGLYCVIEVTLTGPDGVALLPVPGDPAVRA